MTRLARVGVAAALAVSGATFASRADAWCRTSACAEGVGSRCSPELPTDCGTPLAWSTPCLGYSLQVDGTKLASFERVRELIALGFAQWTSVDCGGAGPGLAVVEMDTVTCAERDFDTAGPNSNLILFRDDEWPYSARALALTTVTYGLDDAIIRDADVEVNSVGIGFTFDDVDPKYDFQSIITHELGHFLGLAHSSLCDAAHDDPDCPTDADVPTMVLSYDRGSTELRTLAPDDGAGLCEVYPAQDLGACKPEIEGGLIDECDDVTGEPAGDDGACCTVAPGAPRRGGGWAASLAIAAGALALAARRRRASRRLGS